MGRKKKLVNNTDIPQYAIERVARCVLDDIREDYLKEEVLKAFVEWEREWRSYTIKRGLQEKKERAANTAALSVLFRLFSLLVHGVSIRDVSASRCQSKCIHNG